MFFLIAVIGALLIGLLVWKAINLQRGEANPGQRPAVRRSPAPDDDPEFLRKLGERFRRDEGETPPPK